MSISQVFKKLYGIPEDDDVVFRKRTTDLENKRLKPSCIIESPNSLPAHTHLIADLPVNLIQDNDSRLTDARKGKTLFKEVTAFQIVNTNVETDMINFTIPANTLGTNKIIEIHISLQVENTSLISSSFYLRVYYGATEIYEDRSATLVTSTEPYNIISDLRLFNKGVTNSQGLDGIAVINGGTSGGANTGFGNLATDEIFANTGIIGGPCAEDSTLDKALRVTVELFDADPLIKCNRILAYYKVTE